MINRLSHIPTALFLIGYPLFWLECWLHPGPRTTPLAAGIFAVVAVYLFWSHRAELKPAHLFPEQRKRWFIVMGVIGIIILGLSIMEGLLPIHLGQEYDAMNYHYALPHQHLIQGSFAHLPWSVADLWPLPIQSALAPYWFVTTLPNKVPQLICFFGLLSVAWTLSNRLAPVVKPGWLVAAGILGSHGLSIQFGSGMLDLVVAYLFLAALDSFLDHQWWIGSVELSFWFWSRSFTPIQALIVFVGMAAVFTVARSWKTILPIIPMRFYGYIMISMLIIGGPFVGKSLYYAGTPLAPLYVLHWGGKLGLQPETNKALRESSASLMTVRDEYGAGRSLGAFIKHFWTVAVPYHGVNNAFDYPLGLPYLLALGPFVGLLWVRPWSLISAIGWLAIFFWASWWIGSQQSRWLYIPVVLLLIVVLTEPDVAASPIFSTGLVLSLGLTALSLGRAYKSDLVTWPHSTLRPVDQALYNLTVRKDPRDSIDYPSKEIAFAQCLVTVRGTDTMWVLPVSNP